MTFFSTFLAASALIGTTVAAGTASAQVTTYSSQASFAAATTGDTSYGFDFTAKPQSGKTYVDGPVTFTSSGLTHYNDAYGMPYLSDNNGAAANSFTISSTTSALGLYLGSYYAAGTYSYLVNGIAGSVALPVHSGTAFLGFSDASGPISVTFTVPGGRELDLPRFITGSAAAVPEPASWAMLILGLGAVGWATRRRQAASRLAFAA